MSFLKAASDRIRRFPLFYQTLDTTRRIPILSRVRLFHTLLLRATRLTSLCRNPARHETREQERERHQHANPKSSRATAHGSLPDSTKR